MGTASRKKRVRRAGHRDAANDSQLASLVRAVLKALVERARGEVDGIPTKAHEEHVAASTEALRDLIRSDVDSDSPDFDILAPHPDRTTEEFMAAVAELLAMRASIADDHELDPRADAEVDFIGRAAAEDLLAFEGLAYGSRLAAILDDGELRTFVAAAMCVLGPSWDPLAQDPLNDRDLGALVAGLAAVRATLALMAAADGQTVTELRQAIETAGVAIRNADSADRVALSDGNSAIGWYVARALVAGFDAADLAFVRTVGGEVPTSFAAGAIGPGWLAQSDLAAAFDEKADLYEQLILGIPALELAPAVTSDPLIAAYVAGRSWRLAPLAGWKLPWDGAPQVH